MICHVAYDQPSVTRKERANNVKKRNYFPKYGAQARKVLEALLDKYSDRGVGSIENPKVLHLDPFNEIGTPVEIINDVFGGKANYEKALQELEKELYNSQKQHEQCFRGDQVYSGLDAKRCRCRWGCTTNKSIGVDVLLKIFDDRESELELLEMITNLRYRRIYDGETGQLIRKELQAQNYQTSSTTNYFQISKRNCEHII